jgi:polar amino acid transport system ATP-binding protein
MNLKINNLTKEYNGEIVLDNISLEINNFNVLAIVGPSGGGKTTFLKILSGITPCNNGDIFINDNKIPFNNDSLNSKAMIEYRKGFGVVFQDYNLFYHLSAFDNIMLPLLKVHKINANKAKNKVNKMLEVFNLYKHKYKKPNQLSGGQKQRIAIIRALAIEPNFLLFDEPTSALDPQYINSVLKMISDLKKNKDFIIVTHHMSFAKNIADKVIFVANGGILACGSYDEVFSCKNNIIESFIKDISIV